MQAVLDAVAERLIAGDELLIRIPEICEATGVNYGSVYHHFGSREGVIDAAYNMIFSRMVEEDMELIREATGTVETLDDYISVILPIVATLNSGPERTDRRALRIRIVAAAMTRPELHALIGATQSRLTEEWCHLIEFAQRRGWLRDDVPANFLAVFLQIMIFGRGLDDISDTPLVDADWGRSISTLFVELLKR